MRKSKGQGDHWAFVTRDIIVAMPDLKLEQDPNIQISVSQLIKSFRSRLLLVGLIIVCCNGLLIISALVNEPVHKSKVLISVFEARGTSGDVGMQIADAKSVFSAAFPDASHATIFSMQANNQVISIDTSAKTLAELKTLTQGASEAVVTVAKKYSELNRRAIKQRLESAIIEHDRMKILEQKVLRQYKVLGQPLIEYSVKDTRVFVKKH